MAYRSRISGWGTAFVLFFAGIFTGTLGLIMRDDALVAGVLFALALLAAVAGGILAYGIMRRKAKQEGEPHETGGDVHRGEAE